MAGILQCVALLDVEMVVVDIVQEHIHTAEVISLQVDFLTEEAVDDIPCAEYLLELKEQRTAPTGRVIDLVDRCAAACGYLSKQQTHLGRRVELSSLGA